MNGRFPIALHIMTLLNSEQRLLPSDYLAGSINVNPVLVRKELSNLIKQGLVKSQEGKKGGYELAISAEKISVGDVYKAVRSGNVLGQARNQPNPACSIGKQINMHLNELYDEVDEALLNKLEGISLQAFCNKFK